MERQELPSRACTQGPRVSPRGWGQSDGDEARGAGRKLMPHVGRQRGKNRGCGTPATAATCGWGELPRNSDSQARALEIWIP